MNRRAERVEALRSAQGIILGLVVGLAIWLTIATLAVFVVALHPSLDSVAVLALCAIAAYLLYLVKG